MPAPNRCREAIRAGVRVRFVVALLAIAVASLAVAGSAAAADPPPDSGLAPPAVPATQLDPAVLEEILQSINVGADAEEPFAAAMWRWLRERFADEGIVLEDWLDALLRVPDSALQWASRLSIAAMVVLAAVVLANELRHGRRRRDWPGLQRRGRSVRAAPPLAWASLAALPAKEQPGAALRLALTALVEAGTAVGAGATHREVLARARRERTARWRRPLARLALLAERARFGRWRPSREEGHATVALGRAVANAADKTHDASAAGTQATPRTRVDE